MTALLVWHRLRCLIFGHVVKWWLERALPGGATDIARPRVCVGICLRCGKLAAEWTENLRVAPREEKEKP